MEINPETILLFKNATKRQDSHPDMKGQANIRCPHCEKTSDLEVVVWGKMSKTGKSFLSGKIKPFEDNEWNRRRLKANEAAREEEAKPVEERAKDLPF